MSICSRRFNRTFYIRSSTPHSENRDKIEVYLAFGASRLEACRPIAKQALRLALTPMISQMRLACTTVRDNHASRLTTLSVS